MKGDGGGAESYDRKNAWSSINHSVLSGTDHSGTYPPLEEVYTRASMAKADRLWQRSKVSHYLSLVGASAELARGGCWAGNATVYV